MASEHKLTRALPELLKNQRTAALGARQVAGFGVARSVDAATLIQALKAAPP